MTPNQPHNQEQGTRESTTGEQQGRGRGGAPRPLRIHERGREAYREAQQLASTLEEGVDEIGQFLRDQCEQRPYVTLATATAIGYVLGGGVPSRLTGFLFGLGSRFAVEMFLRELVGDAARAVTSGSGANRSVS